jgi:hypothetical protein
MNVFSFVGLGHTGWLRFYDLFVDQPSSTQKYWNGCGCTPAKPVVIALLLCFMRCSAHQYSRGWLQVHMASFLRRSIQDQWVGSVLFSCFHGFGTVDCKCVCMCVCVCVCH